MNMQSKENFVVYSRVNSPKVITLSSFVYMCGQGNPAMCADIKITTLGKSNNLRIPSDENHKIKIISFNEDVEEQAVHDCFRRYLKYGNASIVPRKFILRFIYYLEELEFKIGISSMLCTRICDLIQLGNYIEDKESLKKSIATGDISDERLDICRNCLFIEESALELPKAIAGLTYGSFNALKWRNDEIETILSRWALNVAFVAINPNLPTIILSILNLVNDFIPLSSLVQDIYRLFKSSLSYVLNHIGSQVNSIFVTQQPTTVDELGIPPEVAEESSLTITEMEPLLELSKYQTSAPVLGAAIGSIFVLFASFIAGSSISDKKKMSFAERTSLSLFNIAKAKSGIYAVIDMVKDVNKYLYDLISDMISGSRDELLNDLIRQSSVRETGDCKKANIFDYLEFILDPRNIHQLVVNNVYKERVEFCYKVLEEINTKFASTEIIVPITTMRYIASKIIDLKKIRLHIHRHPSTEFTRFTPFWINLVGKPGTRKSQFMPLLAKSLMEVLNKSNITIPPSDNWLFSVNFTEKYMTAYKQQYIVAIDDLFQDKVPLGERSSALDLITWVSNITHYTNQAALEDKGMPFESKIIISSSNDMEMSRSEINDVNAIRRRMNIFAEFVRDDKIEVDELLGARIKINVYKYEYEEHTHAVFNQQHVKKFLGAYTSKSFITRCAQDYLKWHEHQQELLRTRDPKPDMIQSIAEEVFSACPSFKVEESSFISCKFVTPSLIRKEVELLDHVGEILSESPDVETHEFYDCDCDKHQQLNSAFLEHIRYSYVVMERPKTIKEFESFRHPTIFNKLKETYSIVYNRIQYEIGELMRKPIAKLILGGFVSLGAVLLARTVLKGESSPNEVEQLEVMESKVKYSTGKPYRAAPKKLIISESSTTDEFQFFGHDEQGKQFIMNTLHKHGSQCLLYQEKTKRLNVGLRIHGTCILSNHHFFKYLEEEEEFVIQIPSFNGVQQVSKQQYNFKSLYRIGDSDLVVYKCDASLRRAKTLLQHFPDKEVLAQQHEAVISTVFPMPFVWRGVTAHPVTFKFKYGTKGEYYDLLDTYATNIPSEKGMSGSLLLALNPKLKNKILGVQVAINSANKCGYFKPVSRVQLEAAIEALGDNLLLHTDVSAAAEECSVVFEKKPCPPNLGQNALQYCGVVSKKAVMLTQNKTKILPSIIHDNTRITREPSALSDYDERMQKEFIGKSIIFRSFEGFDSKIGSINTRISNMATDDLAAYYDVKLNDVNIPRRVLTDYEMVNGIPVYLKRLEMKSSPGYPYVKQRKRTDLSGKYEWFEEDELQDGYTLAFKMNAELRSGVERRFEHAKKGLNSLTLAYACLKDETRPIAKIDTGSTRTFICLPMDFNLLVRKLFGAFIAAQHAHAVDIPSGVGIDPAKDWRRVFEKLAKQSPEWEDFDYKNWDQHLHPEFIMRVADIVNRWYGDDGESDIGRARRVLLYDLVHTFIIVKDRLFVKSTGQCSGCAITAELNCLVHDLLMYYVWILLHEKSGLTTNLSEFRDHVYMILYGDDIVKAVNPEYRMKFYGEQIKPVMDSLGMGITPGDKLSTEFKLKPPNEITFLKRTFVKEGNDVKAPLNKEIIENIFQWINKSDDPLEATRINCEMALQEAFMHGRIYFLDLRDEINKRIKDFNSGGHGKFMQPVVLNYEEFERKYRKEEYVCLGIPSNSEW